MIDNMGYVDDNDDEVMTAVDDDLDDDDRDDDYYYPNSSHTDRTDIYEQPLLSPYNHTSVPWSSDDLHDAASSSHDWDTHPHLTSPHLSPSPQHNTHTHHTNTHRITPPPTQSRPNPHTDTSESEVTQDKLQRYSQVLHAVACHRATGAVWRARKSMNMKEHGQQGSVVDFADGIKDPMKEERRKEYRMSQKKVSQLSRELGRWNAKLKKVNKFHRTFRKEPFLLTPEQRTDASQVNAIKTRIQLVAHERQRQVKARNVALNKLTHSSSSPYATKLGLSKRHGGAFTETVTAADAAATGGNRALAEIVRSRREVVDERKEEKGAAEKGEEPEETGERGMLSRNEVDNKEIGGVHPRHERLASPDLCRTCDSSKPRGHLLSVLVKCLVGSKRTCDVMISSGSVTVNGIIVDDPYLVVDLIYDKLRVDGVETNYTSHDKTIEERNKLRRDKRRARIRDSQRRRAPGGTAAVNKEKVEKEEKERKEKEERERIWAPGFDPNKSDWENRHVKPLRQNEIGTSEIPGDWIGLRESLLKEMTFTG
eukprot:GHVQ01037886.1.p1 GENE.GHVQ01037886.1~~GHVQ01037886.1.p1  ORF type:complete len:613 (+),score=124.21 GHVQ01037886.1:223-1839(+)